MRSFAELKKDLFDLLLVKYQGNFNPSAAAAYSLDGFVSYYRNYNENDKVACILMDIEDVKKGL